MNHSFRHPSWVVDLVRGSSSVSLQLTLPRSERSPADTTYLEGGGGESGVS